MGELPPDLGDWTVAEGLICLLLLLLGAMDDMASYS
jgi:hypothetical protein